MNESSFQIHLGSYDGILMGFQGTVKSLENNYSFNASNGSIKSLCILNKYLFAGGFDEIIKVFNLNKMKEDGQLEGHEGSITCMKGFKNFLFTGGEDGNILVWKIKEWGLLHKISAHSKAVLDLEVHSSGKLMISLGKEQKLVVWNLLNFQKTFTRKFSYEIFKAKFNSTEDLIILMGEKKMHLLRIETNKMLKVFVHEQKLHDFIVYGDKYLICGDELGEIYIWDISSIQGQENENQEEESKESGSYIKFKAHDKRIKQIQIVKYENMDYLITCSSDGFIKIWDVLYLVQKDQKITGSQDLGDKVESVFKINSRERICCMEVNNLKVEKKKNEDNKEQDEQKEEKEVENKEKKNKKKKKVVEPKMKKKKSKGNTPSAIPKTEIPQEVKKKIKKKKLGIKKTK